MTKSHEQILEEWWDVMVCERNVADRYAALYRDFSKDLIDLINRAQKYAREDERAECICVEWDGQGFSVGGVVCPVHYERAIELKTKKARRSALEEAAAYIDGIADLKPDYNDEEYFRTIATRIRALKGGGR